jgi:hypothetical protein
MFKNAYAQVALTYFRRMLSPWWMVLVILFAFLMMVSSLFGPNGQTPQRFWDSGFVFFFQGFTILFFLTAIHIKSQFADARSHLLPGFHKSHVAVAAAVVLLVTILLPMATTQFFHLHSMGLLAFMTFWFGLVCWLVLFQKTWQMFAILLVFFAGAAGGKSLETLCSGRFELQALGLLALGLMLIVFCGVRLIRANEDMPEYHSRINLNNWAARSSAGSVQQQSGGLSNWLTANQMAAMVRHARRAKESPWSRICRWQIGMQTGWMLLWFVAIISLSFAIPFIVLPIFVPTPPIKRDASIAYPAMMCVIVGAASAWGVLARRRSQAMYYEILLPIERAAYLKQVGMAAAMQQFTAWGAFAVLSLALQQMFVPQATIAMANVLIYSSLVQIGMFGLGVWFLRYRTLLPGIVGVFVLQFTLIPVIFLSSPGVPASSIENVLLAGAAFAAFGLLAAWDGYRRWLTTDVG